MHSSVGEEREEGTDYTKVKPAWLAPRSQPRELNICQFVCTTDCFNGFSHGVGALKRGASGRLNFWLLWENNGACDIMMRDTLIL